MDWVDVWSTLNGFLTLDDGWDGDGAKKPTLSAIIGCSRFLTSQEISISPPDRILATPEGTVIAEWMEGKFYCEAEFISYSEIEWLWTSDEYKHLTEYLTNPDE